MKIKKILSAVLSAAMCLSIVSANVYADKGSSSETAGNNSSQDEYAFGAMSRYMSLADVDKSGDVSISNPVTLNDLDETSNDKTIYFAISANNLVAMLTVDEVNGEYASSFMPIDYEELNSAYINSTPISLNIIDECLVLYNGNSRTKLIDTKKNEVAANPVSRLAEDSLVTIENTNKVLELTNNNSRSIILSRKLDVKQVDNKTINKVGICWAAVVAQNVNYLNGTSYTATNIYNMCVNAYGGTPVGDEKWMKRAYDLCGITVTVDNSSKDYNQIYGLLYNGRPLQIDMELASNREVAHSVSLSGIEVIDSPSIHAYYYIVDPNVTKYPISIEASYDVMQDGSKLVYVASYSGYVFDNWYRTTYKS